MMRRNLTILRGFVAVSVAIAGCQSSSDHPSDSPSEISAEPARRTVASGPIPPESAALDPIDRDYPLYGLVTRPVIVVRSEPNPDATPLGWLRIGNRLRLKSASTTTSTCQSGWYELHPRGWACAGQGIDVSATAPEENEMAPHRDEALPYHYYFVKEQQVPEWHQLPSRDDQRDAAEHAARYIHFLEADQTDRAEQLRAGSLAGEPPAPHEVARWLDHGFYVAGNGVETRSHRRFVRTVRGSFVKESQLEERTGAEFHGIELDESHPLPVAWAIRAGQPMLRRDRADGTTRVVDEPDVDAIPRLAIVDWVRQDNIEDRLYHVIRNQAGEERLLRDWFVAVARPVDPPSGIADDEPWVHVDLSSQTLVLYRGATPIYATLVSSGVSEHETPVGEFVIRRKMVTDTMADLGSAGGDDRYRIEDVPWTQYFSGSVALHAAFWHTRFGQARSHGCVNLAPRDAQFIFQHTWPVIPEGWHGVSTDANDAVGSRVIVTP